MDPRKDYYKILGVGENASQDEIKKAYRRLAKQYHPDTHAGDKKAEERFKDISEAYAALNDPKKRREYDLMRKNPFASGRSDFGGQGGFRVNFEDLNQGVGGIDDLLGNLFGFGGRRTRAENPFSGDTFRRSRSRQPIKGNDLQMEVTIPFELAVQGGETVIHAPGGKNLKLKIAVNTEDGKKVKMTGRGYPAPHGGQPGDLYVVLHVADHPRFERKGDDIYSSERINIAQALLGTEIEVLTIYNKKVKLKIPAGTDSGKLFRLKGLGIQKPNGKGDHYVRIEIGTPKHMSSGSKKRFEEWARKMGLLS